MNSALRDLLWNHAVLLIFALPALGYLGFLSQFVFGEPTGPVRTILVSIFLFALPVMALYSTFLGPIAPIDQDLGTVGFFVFAYLVAVILVWATRQSRRFVRGRRPSKKTPDSESEEA